MVVEAIFALRDSVSPCGDFSATIYVGEMR